MICGTKDKRSEAKENEKWFLREMLEKKSVGNSELENDSGGESIVRMVWSKSELGVDYNMLYTSFASLTQKHTVIILIIIYNK